MDLYGVTTLNTEGLEHGLMNYKDTKPPPPPPPCVNNYTVYTYTECGGGGVWAHRRGGGLRQIKHLPQRHLALLSISLIFLRHGDMKCLKPLFMGGWEGRGGDPQRPGERQEYWLRQNSNMAG